jgi:glycolate oxidase FAD binding subunit
MANMEHALRAVTDRIAAARADNTPLRLRGGGSKDFLGASHGELLDTRALTGVISYEPTELVVTVGAGTALTELEALLAEQGQCLPFEPPHYAWSRATAGTATVPDASSATVGGMVAAGLAGPARASVGGVRDYVLGVKLINGLGQHLNFGGQVMKNVAGYDVSRLMVGARGTLGLLTEISLKVLPVAPAEATLVFELGQTAALAHLHRWGAQPLPLNASCWVLDDSNTATPSKNLLFVRLRGARAAVNAACFRMLADAPGHRMDTAKAAVDWTLCRNQQLPFFQAPPSPDCVLWRLSLPQTAAVLDLPFAQLVEWHGGLRWLWAPLRERAAVTAAAHAVGGTAQVFMAPAGAAAHAADSGGRLNTSTPAEALVAQRLKASFDPQGIFNSSLSPHANHASA